jgi:uncharacterized protein (DUF433 family)
VQHYITRSQQKVEIDKLHLQPLNGYRKDTECCVGDRPTMKSDVGASTMQTAVDIGTLITQTPGICGGRPRIAGTRTAVQTVVIDFNAGMTPEEILAERPHLNHAQIYAALAYYYAHKRAIDAEITAYYDELNQLEAQ